MASAVVGALRVNLSANTSAFSNGLKGADSQLKRFSSNMKASMAAIGIAVAGAVAALGVAFRGAAKDMDNLAKTSQAIGVPVEELSRLRHAADLSGVSFGQLSTAVGRLSRNLSDVAAGAGAEARRAFDQLGISVKNSDGTLKSSSQTIEEIADRFAGMADGSQKTALALQLFGRSGAALIPLLNQGADGIRKLKDEADALGITIDTKTAQAAERFNDNLTRLGRVKDGIIQKMTAGMLPSFERLSQVLVDGALNTDIFTRAGEALGRGMEGLARAILFVIDNINILIRVASVFIAMKLAGVVLAIGRAFIAFAGAVRAAGIVLAGFNAISALSRRGLIATATILALVAGQFEAVQEKVRQLGGAIRDILPADMAGGLTKALEALSFNTDALTREFEALDGTAGNAANTLQDLEDALKGTANGMGKVGQAAKAAGEPLNLLPPQLREIGSVGQQVTSTLESSFSSLFDSAVDGTFKLRDAIGNLLKDLGRLLANQAFRGLLGGFGGGGLFGGLQGFAQGGSFRVGGSGGIDSQLVAFRATPGEQVEIRKPGQDGGGAQHVHVTVGVDVDGSGNIRPFVADVASAVVQRQAPGIAVEAWRDANSRAAFRR